ncbi:MAG: hypothetical protein GX130_03185 [Candidatus Hydrogenedens sp.]|nr:hypothetical protein [Candidatus Hydrogenedens sp.]
MNHSSTSTYLDRRIDWIIATLLFLFGFLAGLAHFESLRQDTSAIVPIEDLYGPAVMIAMGHGFIVPDYAEYPEFQDFLRVNQDDLSPDHLPEDIETGYSAAAFYHRYLLYAVGFIWRIFGISWKTLEPFIALFLGWYALSLYFLLRFFLSRCLAFLSSLLLIASPAVFMVVLDLRDFSKAPFTITLFCLLLWLFTKRHSLRSQILGAVLLGMLHGIFMGFRQDALIFLPLCICLLLFFVFMKKDLALWKALTPLFLYLSLFFALAMPMFQSLEGNAQPQHVLVQGFARDRMDQLGMKQASYQSLLSGADYYTFSMLSDFASRTPDLTTPQLHNDPDTMAAGQRWLQESVFLYPADLVTRGWTAIWRILRYADAFPSCFTEPTVFHQYFNSVHRSFAFFMHRAGLPLGILAIFLVALRFPGTAMAFFLISSYILGYTALQTACRHTFHLSFFPFLITAFLIEILVKQIWKRKQTHSTAHSVPQKQYKAAMGVLLLCASLVVLPMPLLRWYQARQLRPIFESCIQAPRTRLPFTKKEYRNWTLFTLDLPQPDSCRSDLEALYRLIAACSNPELHFWNVRTRYILAEFDGSTDITDLLHCYNSRILNFNFSQLLHMPVTKLSGDVLRYFFPVYEVVAHDEVYKAYVARGRFSGIALPREFSSQLRGLYEVDLPEEVTHLMAFTSLDDKIPSPLFYTPDCFPDPVSYQHIEHKKINNTFFSEAAQRYGTQEQLTFFTEVESILFLFNEPIDQIRMVNKFMNFRRFQDAIELALQIETTDSEEREMLLETLKLIAQLSLYEGETKRCLYALEALETLIPEHRTRASLLKIEACERAGMKEEALEIYRDYLKEHPDDESAVTHAHILLSHGFTSEEKHAFWQSLTDHIPDQAYFQLYLAMALDLQGKEFPATEAYNKAFALDPNDPKIMICHLIAQAEHNPREETVENIKHFAIEYPENKILVFQQLEKKAFFLSEKGLHEKAGSLLLLAARYSPESEGLILQAHQQFTGAGDYAKAEKGLMTLLSGDYGQEAAQALYVTVKLSRDFADRLHFWLGLQETHPNNSTITSLLYTMYEDRARELFVSAQMEELGSLNLPDSMDTGKTPFLLLYQAIARYMKGQGDLKTISRDFPVTTEEKEKVGSDLASLGASLNLEDNQEQSERIAEVMHFLDLIP